MVTFNRRSYLLRRSGPFLTDGPLLEEVMVTELRQ
jgi:hypothetical protein